MVIYVEVQFRFSLPLALALISFLGVAESLGFIEMVEKCLKVHGTLNPAVISPRTHTSRNNF